VQALGPSAAVAAGVFRMYHEFKKQCRSAGFNQFEVQYRD